MDKNFAWMLKKINLGIIISLCLFILGSCSGSNNETTQEQEYLTGATLIDYESKNDYVTFKTNLFFENPTDKAVYFSVTGSFEKEYKVKMIEEKILTGYDPTTKGAVFMLSPHSQTIFEVWFSSEGDSSVLKPDRLLPDFVLEEIPFDEVHESEFVTEFSMTLSD